MVLDAEEGKKDQEEFVATYCCYFEVRCFAIWCLDLNENVGKKKKKDESRTWLGLNQQPFG